MEFKKLPIGTGMKFKDLPIGAEFIFIPDISLKPLFVTKCKKVVIIESYENQRVAILSGGGVTPLDNDVLLEKEVIVLI